jgi:hypothetical protein
MNRIEVDKGMSVVHNSGNVLSLYVDDVLAGWEMYLLVTSDRHHDKIDCNRELELDHLEKAKERGAFIIDVGDLFDAMQGKYDPRRTYNDLRPEYKVDNYLDEIVADAAKFYAPYADRFLVIGKGNHETSILKNNSVDLTNNLVHRLNYDHGGHIQPGGYGGWVRILVSCASHKDSILIRYFHGSGGGGEVTRGAIQTNRQAVYLPDADIVLNGHTHDAWHIPIARHRISGKGSLYQDIQHHIRTSTYSNDYDKGSEGWYVETGKPPKPMGAVWIRLSVQQAHTHKAGKMIVIEPTLAIE